MTEDIVTRLQEESFWAKRRLGEPYLSELLQEAAEKIKMLRD